MTEVLTRASQSFGRALRFTMTLNTLELCTSQSFSFHLSSSKPEQIEESVHTSLDRDPPNKLPKKSTLVVINDMRSPEEISGSKRRRQSVHSRRFGGVFLPIFGFVAILRCGEYATAESLRRASDIASRGLSGSLSSNRLLGDITKDESSSVNTTAPALPNSPENQSPDASEGTSAAAQPKRINFTSPAEDAANHDTEQGVVTPKQFQTSQETSSVEKPHTHTSTQMGSSMIRDEPLQEEGINVIVFQESGFSIGIRLLLFMIGAGILGMVFTAWQMADFPDGPYAVLCRWILSVFAFLFSILLLRPCRRQQYGSHVRVATMDYDYKEDPNFQFP